MSKIKTWIRDHWLRVMNWLIAAIFVLLIVTAWALHGGNDPASPTTTTEVSAVGHCGCEGACSKCHHLCLECKCGSHIIDRGIKCQEFAACEAGCSGAPDVPDGTPNALWGAPDGVSGDSDVDCDLVRGQADILGSNMAENYTDNDALLRDTKLLQEVLEDCGCASAGVGYSGTDVKCPCNVCPWNCL